MPGSYMKKLLKQTLYKQFLNHNGSFKYFGEKVFFPKSSTTFNLALRDGIYERDILNFVNNLVKLNSTYIDVGANIGLMSIPILSKHRTVNVISIEASPNTFQYLQSSWNSSNYKDRWSLYHYAASNNNSEMDFFTASNAHGAYESLQDTKRINFTGKIKVPGITIDEIWNTVNRPYVSVIKSDIEGSDLIALQGADSCIANCNPYIILEWNRINILPFKLNHSDLLNFCVEKNYRCYAIPSMVTVSNILELELQSANTENFLLAPLVPGDYEVVQPLG